MEISEISAENLRTLVHCYGMNFLKNLVRRAVDVEYITYSYVAKPSHKTVKDTYILDVYGLGLQGLGKCGCLFIRVNMSAPPVIANEGWLKFDDNRSCATHFTFAYNKLMWIKFT